MLWTRVETSPIQYANLGKTGVKRSSLKAATSCPDTLGPGSYDAPVPQDVRVSLMLNQNQMSRCALLLHQYADVMRRVCDYLSWQKAKGKCMIQHGITGTEAGNRLSGPDTEPWQHVETGARSQVLESRCHDMQGQAGSLASLWHQALRCLRPTPGTCMT